MKVSHIRLLQQALTDDGLNPGPVDGVLGDNTYTAVSAALGRRQAALPPEWQGWPNSRRAVACLQLYCQEHSIEVGTIDGLWGPQTAYAVDALAYLTTHGEPQPLWRDMVPGNLNPHNWPSREESALIDYYGQPGARQTTITLPYPLRISWDLKKSVNAFSCHELVRPSLATCLNQVLDHYGADRIRKLGLDLWGGCLNPRRERGGSRWSTHAWGIAIDFDPDRNQLKWGRDRATLARPDYDAWWQIWEAEGWVSLGRTKNYDWMHVQAAKL